MREAAPPRRKIADNIAMAAQNVLVGAKPLQPLGPRA